MFGLYMCFFFFKQKTAYEMRISDWSSDVCSSDLVGAGHVEVSQDDVAKAVRAVDVAQHPFDPQFGGAIGTGRPRRCRLAHRDLIRLAVYRRRRREPAAGDALRSEERRVGKECVSTV